jgi:hypothetical protein
MFASRTRADMALPFRMPLQPFAEVSRTTILISLILGGDTNTFPYLYRWKTQ